MYMYIGQYRYAHRTRFIAMFFVRSHLSLLSNSPTPGTVGLFFKFNFSSSNIRAFKRAVKNLFYQKKNNHAHTNHIVFVVFQSIDDG